MQPLYLDGTRGRLFALHFAPEQGTASQPPILFVPPFAEEMNRSRRSVTRQSRHLAALGHPVLVFDLFGTGDSEGAFQDARWDTWRDDVLWMSQWLSGRYEQPIMVWALRLGALLALDSFYHQQTSVDRYVFWNPVLSGKPYMDQFMRQSLAEGHKRSGISIDGLRLRIAKSEPLEVIGYILSRQLIQAIDRSLATNVMDNMTAPVIWIESGTSDHGKITQLADVFRSTGAHLETVFCKGSAFWAIEGSRAHPDLTKLTCAALESIP